ncbi:MAG TPA: TMEM175 family protein [Rhodanobacter sp.]
MNNRVDEPVRGRHVGQRHLDRLIMLSDGIFAIAITLSAVEIRPEMKPGQTLWQAWSTPLLVYFLSFLMIGLIWFSHRRIVAHLRDIDAIGTSINLVLLSLVALMPVMIRFALVEVSSEQGFVVYSLALAITFTCMAALWFYVAFVARLAPDLENRQARIWLLEMLAAPLIMAAFAFYRLQMKWAAMALTLVAVALWAIKSWLEYSIRRGR